jgi:hypothetical protein
MSTMPRCPLIARYTCIIYTGLSQGSGLPIEGLSTLYPKEQPMSSDHEEVWNSRSAAEIVAYCEALAQELGLTVENVQRGHALHPDHLDDPYDLCISITEPFEADPQFWFTREEVLGYATGTTKAAIESRIRTDLESHLRDDV